MNIDFIKPIYRFFWISFVLLLVNETKAQVNSDSLKKIASFSRIDTLRIDALNELAVLYSQTDLILSKKYVDAALKEIEIAQVENEKINTFYSLQKGKAYNTLCHLEQQKGNIKEAIQYCFKAISIFEKQNNKSNLSKLYVSVAINLEAIGNNKDAIVYLKKALVIDESIKPKSKQEELDVDLVGTYINLAGAYLNLELNDSSDYYNRKGFSLTDTIIKTENLGLLYYGKACIYNGKNQNQEAILYLKKSLQVFEYLKIPEQLTLINNGLAECYYLVNDYKNALIHANKSEVVCTKHFFMQDLLFVYETKANIYSALHDNKNEIFYLKKSIILKDSLLQINHKEQIEELRTQYETKKKETEIIKLNSANKIQELQIQNDAQTKNNLYIVIASILIGAILLGLFLFYLNKLLKLQKQSYIALQQKNIEIKQQTDLILKQEVELSKYQSQMNPHFVSNAINGIQGFILEKNTDKAFVQTQLLSKIMRLTLNHSDKELITLKEDLDYNQQYINFELQRFAKPFSYHVNVNKIDLEDVLIPPMLLQPILENSIKHAGFNDISDARIDVIISELEIEKLLLIEISDNGIGIDLEALKKSNSKAIKITRGRVEGLLIKHHMKKENCFEINKRQPTGTITKIYIPLLK